MTKTVKQKWIVLAQQLAAVGMYDSCRLDPMLLQQRFFSGNAIMKETQEIKGNRTIKAYGALWETNDPGSFEIGTVFVHPDYRKQGLLIEVMGELLRRSPEGSRLFFITADEKIQKLATYSGFVPVTTEVFPNVLAWASSVGITSRLPRSVHPIVGSGVWGVPSNGERWLYVREPK